MAATFNGPKDDGTADPDERRASLIAAFEREKVGYANRLKNLDEKAEPAKAAMLASRIKLVDAEIKKAKKGHEQAAVDNDSAEQATA